MMEQLNKAHDVFVAEFPEAKAEAPQMEPEPEVAPAAEAPVEEPAPAAPVEPATAPQQAAKVAPGAAPAAQPEATVEAAVKAVTAHENYDILRRSFARGESYGKLSTVVRDIQPHLTPTEIRETVLRLSDLV